MYEKETLHIFKYQGAGNDFIIVENRDGHLLEAEKQELAKKLCNRHFGVGGDGLILAESSESADARMRIFNPDGSEAEMCGNGIRCLGRYLYETGTQKPLLRIDTLAGVKEVRVTLERGVPTLLEVEMGAPRDVALRKKLKAGDRVWDYSYLDTGVPHVVIFMDDLDDVDVETYAPSIRSNPLFPQGANVNFVGKTRERSFRIRTFERGVEAETLACGTGITASGIAAVFLGLAPEDEELTFHARGGTVHVRVKREEDRVKPYLKGTAEYVFQGELQVNNL